MAEHNHTQLTSPAWLQHRAARSLAHHARDAAELAVFLDMLDLTAEQGLSPPQPPTVPTPRRPPAKLDADSACRLSNLLREAHHGAT